MEIKSNIQEWDFEKIKAKIIEIFKFFWGQKIFRRCFWIIALSIAGTLIALQLMIYVTGVVFYELLKLVLKIFGVHL